VAGEFGTWKLVFTAGVRGLSTGGGLRISTDSDSDWGWPQFAEPGEAEYTTAVGPLDSSFALTSGDHLTLAVTVVGRPIKVLRLRCRPLERRVGIRFGGAGMFHFHEPCVS